MTYLQCLLTAIFITIYNNYEHKLCLLTPYNVEPATTLGKRTTCLTTFLLSNDNFELFTLICDIITVKIRFNVPVTDNIYSLHCIVYFTTMTYQLTKTNVFFKTKPT